MWNCRIVGEVPKAGATVSATVDQVDAMSECDAAVRASGVVAALFSAFNASTASSRSTKGVKSVPAVKPPESDLPIYSVQVVFVVPERRTSVSCLLPVSATSEAAAIALGCARLGKALAEKLENVVFSECTAELTSAAPQPSLFRDGELPPVEVIPGTPAGFVCRCGHAFDRHEGGVSLDRIGDVVKGFTPGSRPRPMKCHGCHGRSLSGGDPVACAFFQARDEKGFHELTNVFLLDSGKVTTEPAPEASDGVEVVGAGKVAKRGRRRDRTGEAQDDDPPPAA